MKFKTWIHVVFVQIYTTVKWRWRCRCSWTQENIVLVEHTRGPSSFNYQDISSSPSASSSSSSASPLSQSAFDFDVEREASRQRGEAGLYLMSTPVRPKKPRRRSSCDGCSNASSSISSTARSRPCQGKRKRTGKTNSKCRSNRRLIFVTLNISACVWSMRFLLKCKVYKTSCVACLSCSNLDSPGYAPDWMHLNDSCTIS